MIVDLRRFEDVSGCESADEVIAFTDTFGVEREIDCRIDLTYKRNGDTYFFHGSTAGDLGTQCHFCLVDVTYRVVGDFDVVVRKGKERGDDNDTEDAPDDIITLALNEHEVSFDQHIIENLIVNIPMQILCDEDCKGLCPECGVNRNKESCKCAAEADPRWDALRKLKNE